MEQFLGGLQILLNWQNFLIIPVGLVIGIVVGAIPGLTSAVGHLLRRYLRRLDHGDPHQYARYIRQCGNTV